MKDRTLDLLIGITLLSLSLAAILSGVQFGILERKLEAVSNEVCEMRDKLSEIQDNQTNTGSVLNYIECN